MINSKVQLVSLQHNGAKSMSQINFLYSYCFVVGDKIVIRYAAVVMFGLQGGSGTDVNGGCFVM
jgi:hypothetical protein